ncbi:hypothetical protein AND_005609 [Anopheles darlingi]|uniref:G-protein coupled receptors family 1 profile domain-containing protein n=1 Tax=Anopheles darlingi TaxID=43151 RepID=W5JF20_ANODA|nr:hypothetical protein AND_005609 [Anopheles darlingi]
MTRRTDEDLEQTGWIRRWLIERRSSAKSTEVQPDSQPAPGYCGGTTMELLVGLLFLSSVNIRHDRIIFESSGTNDSQTIARVVRFPFLSRQPKTKTKEMNRRSGRSHRCFLTGGGGSGQQLKAQRTNSSSSRGTVAIAFGQSHHKSSSTESSGQQGSVSTQKEHHGNGHALRRTLVLPETEYERITLDHSSASSNRNALESAGGVDPAALDSADFRCEDGYFRCNGTLQCIEQSKNCNGFPDCDDGSDELECDDDVGRNYYDHYFRKRPAAINDQLPYTPCAWNDANNTCKCRGTDVLCENKGLTALPPSLSAENVTLLDLTGNVFLELHMNMFQRFQKLSTLVLRHCSIERIEPATAANSIDALHLDQNGLTVLPDVLFPAGTVLRILDLKDNLIDSLTEDVLQPLTNLRILYLNNNRLRRVHQGMIPQLLTLQTLSLAKNQIDTVEVCALHLPSLEHLYLSENQLTVIRNDTFGNLTNLVGFHFSEFHHCKAAMHVRVCEPKGDGISSNRHLLDNPVLRASVWVMAAVGIIGNLMVLFGRYVVGSRSSQAHLEHSLYLRHLAASDLLMGVYLAIIATADIIFRGEYLTHEEEWRYGTVCALSGFLNTLSCQSSTLLLTLVTWDRLVSVTRPLYQRPSSKTRVILRLVVLWGVATAAAVAPLSATEYFGPHFYGSNGVCLSIHIHDPYAMGWEYSAGLFILVNTFSLLFIGISYLRMLQAIRVSRNETRNTLNCREKVRPFSTGSMRAQLHGEVVDAKVVFSARNDIKGDDGCVVHCLRCGITQRYEISPSLYAWLAVLVLPVNSALNPVLYTLTTAQFKQQLARFCYTLPCGTHPELNGYDSAIDSRYFKEYAQTYNGGSVDDADGGGGRSTVGSFRVRHRPFTEYHSGPDGTVTDHRNHRHCFLPNSNNHHHHHHHHHHRQGSLRVPSLPSSPSTIITSIDQERDDRDIPLEMTALVVLDPSNPTSTAGARFLSFGGASNNGANTGDRGVSGGGGSATGGGSSGRKRSSAATVQVLMLMEQH